MRDVNSVAVIGGGVIGMSWASLFLARGRKLTVVDPRPEAEADLHAFVDDAWPTLDALGLIIDGATPTPEFTTEIGQLDGIDFVTECGPDRIELKREIVEQLESVIDSDVLVASSTSSLMATDIQSSARHPGRVLVAHPMNPPHMVPMVELVAGEQTDASAIDDAETFYRDELERVTIRVNKEMIGHLANRLTSALYREAVNVVAEGIGSVEDVDTAITYGPGMRWALMGPHLTYHLGGGAGGYRHYLDHLGPTQEARWAQLGTPALTDEVKDALVAGLDEELESQNVATLVGRRDHALVELFHLKRKYGF